MSKSDQLSKIHRRIRAEAHHRCGYCLSPQKYVMAKLEIEHIIPRSRGGSDNESNLWLACSLCNRYKGSQISVLDPSSNSTVSLFNPNTQIWGEHFSWTLDGVRIIGLTPTGRATVKALQLNNELAVEVRRNWVLAGWHPPE